MSVEPWCMDLFAVYYDLNNYVILHDDAMPIRIGQVIRAEYGSPILLHDEVTVKWIADNSVTVHRAAELRYVSNNALEALVYEAEGVRPPNNKNDWLG